MGELEMTRVRGGDGNPNGEGRRPWRVEMTGWRQLSGLDERDAVESGPAARPSLIVNPVDDASFFAAAHRMVASCEQPADLQGRLRDQYPNTVVRARELSGDSGRVWYVYRDGHWTAPQRAR